MFTGACCSPCPEPDEFNCTNSP